MSRLTESLQLSLATGQRLAVARGLEAFAALAARTDDLARAVRLAGAALELRAAVAKVPAAGAGARLEDLLEPARRRLGEGATAGLLAEGRAMTADQAIRYAMSADRADQPDARRRPAPDPGREQWQSRGQRSVRADPAGMGDRGDDRPRPDQPADR